MKLIDEITLTLNIFTDKLVEITNYRYFIDKVSKKTLESYQKEYENSPEGKAKKYQLENYCGWCNGKIAQRKFKPCYDGSRQQGQCYSSLYDGKPSFLSYEYGQEFFCSPGCAINSCQNKH